MNEYDVGDVVRLLVTFTNSVDDSAVDPATVTARVKSPVGVKTAYVYGTDVELVKVGTGNYRLDIEPAIQGVWRYRFEGTGTYKSAGEASFEIVESVFD